MNNLAIIPARSGSKGLANKNILPFCGLPLLHYSVEAALNSGVFDTVMVSTDSEKYADIARKCGAEVPFLRKIDTSSDTASSWDMIDEVLKEYKKLDKEFNTFCLLQPTSPLRTADDIINAYKIYDRKKASFVVSVCEMEHPVEWSGYIDDNGSMGKFISRKDIGQRQCMGKRYRLNGAVYIANIKSYDEDHFIYRDGCFAFIMPPCRSLDIDTKYDFELAEFVYKKQRGEK